MKRTYKDKVIYADNKSRKDDNKDKVELTSTKDKYKTKGR